MKKKRWNVNPANKELQEILGKELNILPITAQLLVNRGLVNCDKAFSFLRPDLKDLHDPFLMKDMERAATRVLSAIKGGQKIAVYGDYDVDGTTSTALLYLFFKEIGVDVACYIPDRKAEGYGLNIEAIKKLHADGAGLIVTVDCGSSNLEEVAFANSLGLDVIVSDHHEMPRDAPLAYAILNPKQEGCAFPFKGLAGVGVAFNFAVALRSKLRDAAWFTCAIPNLKRYLDLVCIGTVADMVPLVDENRVLVSFGLKELENTNRPGLKALKEAAGLKPGKVEAENIAFQLAPRINAAGRIAQATMALKLLVADDYREACHLAETLNRENTSRQKLEAETLEQALAMLEGAGAHKGIVLFSDEWHPGVVGIVASRLVERFSRPVVLIALEGDIGKGSARGVRSFDILEGLKACGGVLQRFGGHKAAAGLTVARENIEAFRAGFMDYLDSVLEDDDLMPEITLDAEVSLNDIDHRLITEIESLAPFGMSNHEPLLCVKDAHIVQTEVVGARHLRFVVKKDGCSRNGIGFGLAGLHPMRGEGYGIAFSPFIDEWQGTKNLRLRIKDVRAGA